MPEHQNIEYKSSWHDDYLKWICGFANVQSGLLNLIVPRGYKRAFDETPFYRRFPRK